MYNICGLWRQWEYISCSNMYKDITWVWNNAVEMFVLNTCTMCNSHTTCNKDKKKVTKLALCRYDTHVHIDLAITTISSQ